MASAVLASRNETNWSTTTSAAHQHQQQQQSSQRSFSNNHNNKNNYMGKFPPLGNPNPNPNQNNFNNHHHNLNSNNSRKQFSHQILNGAVEELIPGDAASFNHNNRRDSDVGVAGVPFSRYVSFDISAYSKSDLRKLKSQLMSALDKVRNLSSRIDTGDVVNRSVSKKRSSPFPPSSNGNSNKEPKRSAPNGRQQQLQPQQQPQQQPQPPPYVASAQVMKSCGTVLKKLSTQKSSIWFNTPVDVVGMGLHDYHTVINRPMDLGTIKDKLDRRVYDSPEDFAADVRLTFNNALRYNPKGHEVNTIAGQYLALFEKWFPPILAKYQAEKQLHFQRMVPRKNPNPIPNPPVSKPVKEDFSVVEYEVQGSSWSKFPSPDPPKMFNPVKRPDPKPVTPPPVVCAPVPVPVPVPEPMPVRTPTPRREPSPVVAPVENRSGGGGGSGRGRKSEGKLPKPKAKDPNKREMSMEEKHKLGAGLQSLPEEKMSQVIQIIRKRNGDLTQDGDEIEVDIEAVDTETLWELDRFVTNYKKMVSKIQRQALLPVRNNAGGGFSDDTNQAGMSDRMMMDTPSKPKKGGVGGGGVGGGGGGGGDGDVAEEDVDIGDEMPVNNFPPLEIDKDDDRPQGGDHSDSSSSSGSSSDDSSSSDSDSGSSSGSDSDVDDAQSRDNGSKNFHH